MHIQVEHCVECHLHNWCSRHNEAKYHEFYDRIEAKSRSVCKNFTISKNQPPEHYIQYSNLPANNLGFHRYFDQNKQEIVVFPRHGSFQIKVNGYLIFSKIQSNLWPNLEKIGHLLQLISEQIERGGDIKKYSLEYRLQNENDDQYFVDTYKKVIKFKINKRPFSSHYNASSYISKGSAEQSNEQTYPRPNIKRNVVSVKKSTHKPEERRPIPRLKSRKTEKGREHVSEFNEFQEGDHFIDDHYPAPEAGKVNRSEKFPSPRARRILMKKEQLGPIKPLGNSDLPGHNRQPIGKLEKKPSKKLVIKVNEKKSEEGSGKKEQQRFKPKITENIQESESIVVDKQKYFNKQASPVRQEKVESKKEEKVEQQIPASLPKVEQTPATKPEEKIEEEPVKSSAVHVKEESSNGGYEDLMNDVQNQQKGPAPVGQIKTIEDKQAPQQAPVEEQVYQEQIKQQKEPVSEAKNQKKKTDKSNQNYDQENYDEYYEQGKNDVRPLTSSSRRGQQHAEEIIEDKPQNQQINASASFKKKNEKNQDAVEKQQIQQYEEEFPVQEGEGVNEIPIIINKKKSEEEEKVADKAGNDYEGEFQEEIGQSPKIEHQEAPVAKKVETPKQKQKKVEDLVYQQVQNKEQPVEQAVVQQKFETIPNQNSVEQKKEEPVENVRVSESAEMEDKKKPVQLVEEHVPIEEKGQQSEEVETKKQEIPVEAKLESQEQEKQPQSVQNEEAKVAQTVPEERLPEPERPSQPPEQDEKTIAPKAEQTKAHEVEKPVQTPNHAEQKVEEVSAEEVKQQNEIVEDKGVPVKDIQEGAAEVKQQAPAVFQQTKAIDAPTLDHKQQTPIEVEKVAEQTQKQPQAEGNKLEDKTEQVKEIEPTNQNEKVVPFEEFNQEELKEQIKNETPVEEKTQQNPVENKKQEQPIEERKQEQRVEEKVQAQHVAAKIPTEQVEQAALIQALSEQHPAKDVTEETPVQTKAQKQALKAEHAQVAPEESKAEQNPVQQKKEAVTVEQVKEQVPASDTKLGQAPLEESKQEPQAVLTGPQPATGLKTEQAEAYQKAVQESSKVAQAPSEPKEEETVEAPTEDKKEQLLTEDRKITEPVTEGKKHEQPVSTIKEEHQIQENKQQNIEEKPKQQTVEERKDQTEKQQTPLESKQVTQELQKQIKTENQVEGKVNDFPNETKAIENAQDKKQEEPVQNKKEQVQVDKAEPLPEEKKQQGKVQAVQEEPAVEQKPSETFVQSKQPLQQESELQKKQDEKLPTQNKIETSQEVKEAPAQEKKITEEQVKPENQKSGQRDKKEAVEQQKKSEAAEAEVQVEPKPEQIGEPTVQVNNEPSAEQKVPEQKEAKPEEAQPNMLSVTAQHKESNPNLVQEAYNPSVQARENALQAVHTEPKPTQVQDDPVIQSVAAVDPSATSNDERISTAVPEAVEQNIKQSEKAILDIPSESAISVPSQVRNELNHMYSGIEDKLENGLKAQIPS